MPKRSTVRQVTAAVVASTWIAAATAGVDVLTLHNDNQRTGWNAQETQLTTTNVKQKFGKLWTLYADAQIGTQPLYVSQLDIPGKGKRNAVIVTTMQNTVYVYDADKKPTQPQSQDALLWAQWLGKPRPSGDDFDSWRTNDPVWGIVGTPVIDPQKTTLYVVTWNDEGANGPQWRLHALDLTKPAHPGHAPVDYRDRVPAPAIHGTVADPAGGPPIHFDTHLQKQRPALLLHDGVLYIGFGTAKEGGGKYHGWLFAYDAATLQQRGVWNVTPTGKNGGIWQAGMGLVADADGHVHLMTGNGTFDFHQGGPNLASSFVKLKLEGNGLVVKDYFTPCNQAILDPVDKDLGSSGPVLIPSGNGASKLLVGAGKDPMLFVLNPENLGKYLPSPQGPNNCQNSNARQAFKAFNGHMHGSPVYWQGPDGGRLYAWSEHDNLRAFKVSNGNLDTAPVKSNYMAPDGMPGGLLSVSSNGSAPGSGIVWALLPYFGDANSHRGVRGTLLAFDAQDVRKELFRSEPKNGKVGPNSMGLFARFAPPTIANGKVFVATYGDQEPLASHGPFAGKPAPNPATFPKHYGLAVYGLKP